MAQPTSQMHNLTTLIKRLEAATSRLEDLAEASPIPDAGSTPTAVSKRTTIPPGPPTSATAPPPLPAEPLPRSVEDFDEIVANEVTKFVELSQDLGELIAEQSKAVEKCFAEQRRFLIITTKAKKPDPSSELFMELLSGMQIEMTKVSNIRENNRPSPLSNHLSTISEGIPGLAWVTEAAKPADFVGEMKSAAQFYGNRVLSAHKDKDQKHVDWVRSYYAVLAALENYVKTHHRMGVVWNANGLDAQMAAKTVATATSLAHAAGAAGGAPSPPPPPPPPAPAMLLSTDGPPELPPVKRGGDIGDVFAELNRGEAVTAGLKKVDKSQITHKNPSLRGGSTVPERSNSSSSLRAKSPAPPSKTKPAHLTKKKPAKLYLDGSKWVIENYENEPNPITIEETEISQSVFIFRCKNTTVIIKGKINSMAMNECVKTNVVGDSFVSGIDIIKSNSFAIQVLQKLPTIQVDQADGGKIYLSEESSDVEIFTSKTSAVNVYIPGHGENGDSAERAVPEQLRHTIKGGQLVSEIVEHAG